MSTQEERDAVERVRSWEQTARIAKMHRIDPGVHVSVLDNVRVLLALATRQQDAPAPGGGERMAVASLLLTYDDGDQHGWVTEFAWLREHHGERLAQIAATARVEGIREPVLLGSDGRVWDGHHRLCVAVDLALPDVPVERVRRRGGTL